MTATRKECSTCAFGYDGDLPDLPVDSDFAECRRYPPKVSVYSTLRFPQVKPDWFCGEWKDCDEWYGVSP